MTWSDDLVEAVGSQAWQRPLPEKPNSNCGPDYATWRLLKAFAESPSAVVDHAVLTRQALRWAGMLRVGVTKASPQLRQAFRKVGLAESDRGELKVLPFRPAWLTEGTAIQRDLDERPHHTLTTESIPAEPWLRLFPAHEQWRSLSQKEACWQALTARSGSVTLVSLPTGGGKSLIFELLARFSGGLTIVIVPTVALAIDHAMNSRRIFEFLPDVNPEYYASEVARAASVKMAIEERTCRLLFVSPEACVSGLLRDLLIKAAELGWLTNVVVDEAHIVESWGAEFRVDFQLLASAIDKWKMASSDRLRTYLLSATFTPSARRGLKELFAGDTDNYREYVSQRLRPEMNYFVHACASDRDRNDAVLDCLHGLPRPLIVYTTEVPEAERLFEIATAQAGFQRIGCFHGDTAPDDRIALLDRWRSDQIDLMIATSAFGLGVDKQDVRAVVHACVPESLDRYYQEVGRGGRDGGSVTCVFLPAATDWPVARGLAPKILGDEKLRLRWRAMWERRRSVVEVGNNVFDLPLHVRREGMFGARSGDENIRWNKRLLLLLLRAGKLRLLDVPARAAGEEGEGIAEWVRVEVRFSSSDDIVSLVRNQRSAELRQSAESLAQVRRYSADQEAICRVLQRQYGAETQRACGTCPACRAGRFRRREPEPLEIPGRSLTIPKLELVLAVPQFLSSDQNEAVSLLRRCVRAGINRFFCSSDTVAALLDCFREAFGETRGELYRLDVITTPLRVRLRPDERAVCVHGSSYEHGLEVINRSGAIVTHWVPRGGVALDANGRLPLLSDGASLFPSVQDWLLTLRPSVRIAN
jgi:ATP-dependent DNA helicase RecQ